ncbi:MAG: carotenoid oxygenase family protein, partial [Nannocystaceae bacterium]|nr:carotenoid oxygenase family protein [Nannocystaceae bacterium]
MRPLQRSIKRLHGWERLEVEGELPKDLRGTLIRTGPGLLERFGKRVSHPFEADGVLSGLRLGDDGEAHASVRVVESPGYLAEEAAGKALFGMTASWWRRWLAMFRGTTKTTGNTSVMHWQGRTYALMEGGRPVEIDHTTLKTSEVVDFDGALGPAFSAHPHRVHSRATTYNFGQVYGPKPALQLYELPDHGPARMLGKIDMPWNTMVHDFAIAGRTMVFVICPAKMRIAKIMLGAADFAQWFKWDASTAAQLILVDLDDIENPKRIDIDARWVFHLANAHMRSTSELVIDWVQYPDFNVFASLSADGESADGESADGESADATTSSLERLVIDLRAGTVRSQEVLLPESCEFPVLPVASVGHAYTTSWYALAAPGIARFDAETGALDAWRPGKGHIASEPVFVPRDGAPSDPGTDTDTGTDK